MFYRSAQTMDSMMLSQNSNVSTYCSEAEGTEIGVNYKRGKASNIPGFPKNTVNSQPNYCSISYSQVKEKVSPPLLSTLGIVDTDSYFPLSQNKQDAKFSHSIKRLSLDSQFPIEKLYRSEFIKKQRKSTYSDKKFTSLTKCKPKFQNKIFETEDRLGRYPDSNHIQYSSRDIDTISITSEDISNVVDRQIALHRKRKEERAQSRSQSSNPSWQAMHSFDRTSRVCESDFPRTYNKQHHTSYSQANQKLPPLKPLNVDTLSKPKKYKLTDDEIIKIADFFKIKRQKFKLAIENASNGIEVGIDISDDDEIKASQSPIKRRYSSSQCTNRSNISK